MFQRISNPFSDSFSNAVIIPMGEYTFVFIAGQVGHPPDGPVKVTANPFMVGFWRWSAPDAFGHARGHHG